MFMMPEASHVYRIAHGGKTFDPGWGRTAWGTRRFYKHTNPLGLMNGSK
ncbi:hypothetical protein NC99_29620 [Sunxiuqinia dokdonensis]|uniref:Uncharacterized protein n=1 Tax=Sunxiuqinia dokdonensis TaxID=1409788 RepID=A0A0L8V727_9BACT|nr:hypothetical protein NC99_29620 [Sunxiuqinia dokdonensis]